MTRPGVSESTTMVRRGGREYPEVYVAQCHVCNSPRRKEIEEAVNSGSTYAKISRRDDIDVRPERIAFHYKSGHMSIRDEAMREIAEKRAEALGRSVAEGTRSIVDGVSLAEGVIQRVWEGIADGSVQPNTRSGLAAAKFLADLGYFDNRLDPQAFAEAFMAYADAARQVMTPDQFDEFSRILDANEALQQLAMKFEENKGARGELGR